MEGICRLYKIKSDLQDSHIYPKFVINYTKKTGSKYLRGFDNPDIRMQDGIKKYLLSRKAEQEFSKREKWFAENIFRPHIAGEDNLKYDSNLFYFIISFLWRIIILELETDDLSSKWYYNLILKAEEEWRNYLIKGEIPKEFRNVYMILTDRIESNPSELQGVDFYMTRIMDATIVDNPTHTFCIIYGKFNKFVFWAVLKEYGDEDTLHTCLINPEGGVYSKGFEISYFPICSFLGNRINGLQNLRFSNSIQQQKIEDEIKKDKDFWEKDLGKSLLNDLIKDGKL